MNLYAAERVSVADGEDLLCRAPSQGSGWILRSQSAAEELSDAAAGGAPLPSGRAARIARDRDASRGRVRRPAARAEFGIADLDKRECELTGDTVLGPIDYLAVEWPDRHVTAEGFRLLMDLVDRGIVRVLDVLFIGKDADGNVSKIG